VPSFLQLSVCATDDEIRAMRVANLQTLAVAANPPPRKARTESEAAAAVAAGKQYGSQHQQLELPTGSPSAKEADDDTCFSSSSLQPASD